MRPTFSTTLLSLCVATSSASAAPVDFAHQIVPILEQHCVACHGGDEAEGGFSLNTRASFLDDQVASPGDPDDSYFLQLITDPDPDYQMPPPDKPRVEPGQIETLRAWVRDGMPWQEGFTFAPDRYEPPLEPRRPELPPAAAPGRTHPVDRLLDDWLAQRNLPRPQPASDAAFLRRAYLDLIGLLPAPEAVDAFIADTSPDKRERLIHDLLADDIAYAEHWLSFWNDLLRNDYTGTGFITGGRQQITPWLYRALVENKPFDAFTRELIAPPTEDSRGFIDGIRWRGDVSAGQTVEIQFAQSVSQSFLGINMKCASCHDSFIDRWTLQDAYGLAAIFAEKPLAIHRCDKPTGETARAAWLFPELGQIDPAVSRDQRLEQLAALMTHPGNGRLTRTVANRLWARLMGRGLVHPLDAMQSRPWHEDLLDHLAWFLQTNDYDLRKTLAHIATSQAYAAETEIRSGPDDAAEYLYRGPRAKRLTAEQFVDAVWQITGSAPKRFDAEIARGKLDPGEVDRIALPSTWIWGASAMDGASPPAGERLLFRHLFHVDRPLRSAGLVATCDNEFTLYLNREKVASGTDWTKLAAEPASHAVKQGANEVLVVATNAGAAPNAAGLFAALRLQFEDGSGQIAGTGPDWEVARQVPPESNPRRWNLEDTVWEPATPVIHPAWRTVENRAPLELASASLGTTRMVRASLVKSDFLMRSLGRPNRDQIVSSRPSQLTTLEALDLYNDESLAGYLSQGATNLARRDWASVDALLDHVYLSTLSRRPAEAERAVLTAALGTGPGPEAIQDLLWAVCMTPEFFLVR